MPEDFKGIPLLVHRTKVGKAFERLKFNHIYYSDLEIFYQNLESYPEDMPPVVIDYQHSVTNKILEATSVHDTELENGTEVGMCPFIVHTLTGEQYESTDIETLKAIAVKHLDDGGKVFAIGVYLDESQIVFTNVSMVVSIWSRWIKPRKAEV